MVLGVRDIEFRRLGFKGLGCGGFRGMGVWGFGLHGV